MDKYIGIGEYMVSNNTEDVIKTIGLASCIGIVAYCPWKKVAGMLHIALPYPTNEKLVKERPGYYAATGIPIFIKALQEEYNCLITEVIIRIYGGAYITRENDVFNIGKKNIEAVKNIFKGLNVKIESENVGGNQSRTIEIKVATGEVKVATLPMII